MTPEKALECARNMFPKGVQNHEEEKRLINLLNRYNVPYTRESLDKILNVDVYETKDTEVKQEA